MERTAYCCPMYRYSSLCCGTLQLLQGHLRSLCSSLINALLARSMSFGVRLSLGRFAVVPYSFHLVMIDLMVLLGIIKDLDIFYNLTLTCTSQQHCPLLVWRVHWSSWQCLVSGASCLGVAASGAFKKVCVCNNRSCDT